MNCVVGKISKISVTFNHGVELRLEKCKEDVGVRSKEEEKLRNEEEMGVRTEGEEEIRSEGEMEVRSKEMWK